MGEYHSMSPSTTLPVHKDSSRTISKTRPKIKIIHIISPEIIKTDVANFRDLVQRLTGKPDASTADVAPSLPPVEEEQKKEAIKKRPPPAAAERGDFMAPQENKKKIKCEVKVQEGGLGDGLDHNELWMDLNPGGFLSFLEEDVFQGMAPDFLQPLGSSRMNTWAPNRMDYPPVGRTSVIPQHDCH